MNESNKKKLTRRNNNKKIIEKDIWVKKKDYEEKHETTFQMTKGPSTPFLTGSDKTKNYYVYTKLKNKKEQLTTL